MNNSLCCHLIRFSYFAVYLDKIIGNFGKILMEYLSIHMNRNRPENLEYDYFAEMWHTKRL